MKDLSLILIILAIVCLPVIGWVKNAYKLTQLDFETPYKAEVFRSIGVVTPFGIIMGYLNFEEETEKAKKEKLIKQKVFDLYKEGQK